MIARELAEKLLEYPDYEVQFSTFDSDYGVMGPQLKRYDVEVSDIGYSSEIIILSGTEQ